MKLRMMRYTFVLLCVFGTSYQATAATIMGGGGDLDAHKPNFSSGKIIPGSTPSDNTYVFSFKATFKVCDVTVRMEDEKGAQITASAAQGITSIGVETGTPGAPVSHGSTAVNPASANGKHDLPATNQVPPHTHFRVNVQAKATASAIRFSLSFSTKPVTVSTSCSRVGDFLAGGGNPIIARPFFPLTAGLLLHIVNEGNDPLTFGRFELMGAQPGIDEVLVPNTSFTATFDGSNAFTLTGDSIAPQQTIEVFIVFDGSAADAGALVARFTGS